MEYNSFVNSAITEENPFISTEEVIYWLEERNKKVRVNIRKVCFNKLDLWRFDKTVGSLRHDSGKFFSIDGIRVETNWGKVKKWEQPIINQPEIGYLGIITKVINGILYFLLQAKIEPGNVNNVQLSPTLQATRSNYSQVHKGKKPLYLDYFQNATKDQVLLDQLQSEQGARFLKKRNRNIILLIKEEIPVFDDFIWLTLGQIKKLLSYDNIVNMDTRTVISGIPFGSYENKVLELYFSLQKMNNNLSYENKMLLSALNSNSALNSFDEILNWLTNLKCSCDLKINKISLLDTQMWQVTDKEIIHQDNKFFRVIAAQIEIGNREVKVWSQPLVEPMQEGIIAFIIKEINGIYHFLIQAKLESGNFDILEMAPTIQCLTGNYRRGENEYEVEFLEYILNPESMGGLVRYSAIQSEEGGRFYKEQNKNIIVEVSDDFPVQLPEKFIWMTLNQINHFIKFNNYFNIQARSLISAINFM